eukprot:gene16744-19093_t
MQYGHKAKDELFQLYSGLVNLNHGSFGTVPKSVMEAQMEFMRKQEQCPELWFRKRYQCDINTARVSVASIVGAELDDIVLVENASYAINGLLRSFPFKAKDVVICFSCAYKMVMEALQFTRRFVDLEIVYIPILYPLTSEEELIESFRQEISKYEKVTMCIFDHVSSMPSIVFPVEQLTALAKTKDAMVVIDGAHAPGMIEIDVGRIGADLYTGNCHKWLFAPKGTAFLWTKRSAQTEQFPQPCVVSSSQMHDYTGRFEYTGTRDYTAFATLPAALRLVNQHLGGLLSMRVYNNALLREGSRIVRDKWKTFYVVPEEMTGFMSNIALPVQDAEKVCKLQARLQDEHHITVVYHSVALRADAAASVFNALGYNPDDSEKMVFFVRLSAQVYLELSDFELLADTVLKLIPTL